MAAHDPSLSTSSFPTTAITTTTISHSSPHTARHPVPLSPSLPVTPTDEPAPPTSDDSTPSCPTVVPTAVLTESPRASVSLAALANGAAEAMAELPLSQMSQPDLIDFWQPTITLTLSRPARRRGSSLPNPPTPPAASHDPESPAVTVRAATLPSPPRRVVGKAPAIYEHQRRYSHDVYQYTMSTWDANRADIE